MIQKKNIPSNTAKAINLVPKLDEVSSIHLNAHSLFLIVGILIIAFFNFNFSFYLKYIILIRFHM